MSPDALDSPPGSVAQTKKPTTHGFEAQTMKPSCTTHEARLTPGFGAKPFMLTCVCRLAKCHDAFKIFRFHSTGSLLELAIVFLLDLAGTIFITPCTLALQCTMWTAHELIGSLSASLLAFTLNFSLDIHLVLCRPP